MAPSESAKLVRRAADGGSAQALAALGWWHLEGVEGVEQDDVKAAALFRRAADLGHVRGEIGLALCYYHGSGLEQNYALSAEWGRKAADQGNVTSQFQVGELYARGGVGVKKDLPLGKTYLELSAAQGYEVAIELLKELRKCVACGKLDVHHMICSWCRNVRYCGKGCQLRHWESPTDPHRPHCGRRREVAGAGGSSSETTADDDGCAMNEALKAAATAKMEAANAAREAAVAAVAAARAAMCSARAAMLAAPAASKKEKKKKAQLVAKVQAAETAAREAAAVLRAALQTERERERERERNAFACIERHQAFALAPVQTALRSAT